MEISNILKVVVCVTVVLGVVGFEPVARGDGSETVEPKVYFIPVGVFVDAGSKELGVYQVEIKVVKGNAKIVGVEGGETKAFEEPPYYDAAALKGGRIILAAFSTNDTLPTGRTRVATMHMQVTGEIVPEYEIVLNVAGDSEGKSIAAEVSVE